MMRFCRNTTALRSVKSTVIHRLQGIDNVHRIAHRSYTTTTTTTTTTTVERSPRFLTPPPASIVSAASSVGDEAAYRHVYDSFRWNVPKYYNIGYDICDRHAEQAPDNVALVFDDGRRTRTMTFGQLARETNRLSNALVSKLGLSKGDRVAILLPQALETAMTHVSAYKAGLIAVPLFTLFKDDALQYRIADCGAKTVVTNSDSLDTLLRIRDRLPDLENIVVVDTYNENYPLMRRESYVDIYDFWKLTQGGSTHFRPVNTLADDPAIIIYTSGTTGPPKGCLHGHRVLPGHMPCVELSHNFFPQEDSVFWTPADWAWIGGLIDCLLPSLYHGVPIVAHRAKKFDPEEALHIMAKHNVRNTFLPPTALKLMANVENPKRFGVQLHSIGSGGESLGEKILHWGREVFNLEINEFYGQTEMNLLVSNSYKLFPVVPGSMGRAVPGHKVEIIDDQGNILPPGEIGIVGALPDPVTFLRYWNKPEATAKKFTPNGYLMTGDTAKRDEKGYFFFVGRDDDIINSSGYRIGPSEIEDCLMKHDAVSLCAAVGTPDPVRNEVVKAFIVLREDYARRIANSRVYREELTKEIQDFVKNRLAAHEYPRQVEFVDSLPMTTTGKIQRKVLKEQELEKYAMHRRN